MLSVENQGLTENVKSDISLNNISLSNFLLAVSKVHNINMTVSPELNQITIANNFTDVTVADLLVFLCKRYELSIEFTGNILSVKKHVPPIPETVERVIPVNYFSGENTISIDAQNDKLYDLFRRIMDVSAKNLVFAPGLENKPMTAYIVNTPFDVAMEKLAFANNLYVEKTDDGFYLFESLDAPAGVNSPENTLSQRPIRKRNADFYFKVINPETQLLEVEIANTPIADVIHDIGNELKINVFTATPLDNAGIVTSFKANAIAFDDLLSEIFESQNLPSGNPQNQNNTSGSTQSFTFKKEGNIYFFGTKDQLSVHKVEIIPLVHRSVELLKDPTGGMGAQSMGFNGANTNYLNQFDRMNNNNLINANQPQRNISNSYNNMNAPTNTPSETLLSIIPPEIQQGLSISVDVELNSFYAKGPSQNIERFKKFIEKIDKPVPVVLIEVMFVEFNKSALIEAGVSWGIGNQPRETRGDIFPTTDLTLGAHTINKIITGFDSFETLNIGQVVPNFYATIKAMETNGKAKIRSTPKLATLNGHRATFSNGETSYYAVTQRNIYGTDNPQVSEITNYLPINAQLGLTIKPLVSENGQVTLDIFVIQSSFGTRIAENAPPNINSREFSSIIRVQDGDIVVLGGLEKRVVDNSGSGVPFLSKIPIIKWLFSSRSRESSKSKLTVFIKPIIFD